MENNLETVNSDLNLEIRRYSTYLVYSGRAVIIFGLWDIVKSAVYLFLNPDMVYEALGVEAEVERGVFMAVFVVLMSGVMIAGMCVRIYVGLCAVNEGRGGKRNPLYIVVAFGYLVVNLMLLGSSFTTLKNGDSDLDDILISFLIECTSAFALGVIIHSAQRLRYLKGKK